MAEKKFGWRRDNLSAAPNPSSKDWPDDRSKDTLAADRPPAQPERTPAEGAPTLKT